MDAFLTGIRIIGGPVPVVLTVVAIVTAVALAARRRRSAGRRWPVVVLSAIAAGGAVGLLLTWVLGDVLNAFDVNLSPVSRAWVAAAFAAIALAIVSLRRSTARRRAGAVGAMLVFLLAGALGVNADFGQYTTVGSITGASAYAPLPTPILAKQYAGAASTGKAVLPLGRTWRAPAGMPARGVVGTVTIAATVSHFPARSAVVYLPPAALVADPPSLPVLVMLSGQPGSPENVFAAGHVDTLLDRIASQNGGLAPIVVVPDQLSAPTVNPMCVDSAIGNSATYLTVDVPRWIRSNLRVQSAAAAWAIGGFSQGGTCAIQLGADHPELFGSILDVSGELEPKIGSPAVTLANGFAGNSAAYEAAKPLTILARRAPYADTVGVFGVGTLDSRFTPGIETVAAAAAAAGIQTTVLHSPGTAHDWATVRYTIQKGIPTILAHMGLTAGSR